MLAPYLLCAVVTLAQPGPLDQPAKQDLDTMQGTWKIARFYLVTSDGKLIPPEKMGGAFPREDLAKLRLVIKKNKVRMSGMLAPDGKEFPETEFVLDAAAKPKQIRWDSPTYGTKVVALGPDGKPRPDPDAGKVTMKLMPMHGLYDLDGDHMLWCFGFPPDSPAPKQLPSLKAVATGGKGGVHFKMFVLLRVPTK